MEGIVKKVNYNDWKDPKTNQNIRFYSLRMDDDNFYSCGPNNPGVSPGARVKFDTMQKGKYTHVAPDTLVVLSQAEKSSNMEEAFNKDNYWDDRQTRIERQSARKDAIAFLQVAQQIDALPIPKSKKAGEKFDLLLGLVETLQREFLGEDTSEDRPVEEESEEG